MSKQHHRRQPRPIAGGRAAPSFQPVPVRARHDGWAPEKQIAFVRALADTCNVEEACRIVGMSPQSAYTLRNRADAGSLRQAWDLALDCGMNRLGDAMLGRALNGVATPIFYKGEQVGERRRYDERLAMWIMRARQPERYGKWRDTMQQTRDNPDGAALLLQQALGAMAKDLVADMVGQPRRPRPTLKTAIMMDDPGEIAAMEAARAEAEQRERDAEWEKTLAEIDADPDYRDDVAPTSSTSGDPPTFPDPAPDPAEPTRNVPP